MGGLRRTEHHQVRKEVVVQGTPMTGQQDTEQYQEEAPGGCEVEEEASQDPGMSTVIRFRRLTPLGLYLLWADAEIAQSRQ